MPDEIFDAEGNPIEPHDADGNVIEGKLMSKEEADEKAEEAKEEFEEKMEEKKSEMEEKIGEKEEEINQIKEDIKTGKFGDKTKNLSGLRKKLAETEEAKEAKETEFNEFKDGIDEKIKGIEGKFTDQGTDSVCLEAAGGDRELAKKIKMHFKTFAPITEEDKEKRDEILKERIESAKILATGGQKGGGLSDVANTEGGIIPPAPGVSGAATHGVPSEDTNKLGKKNLVIS